MPGHFATFSSGVREESGSGGWQRPSDFTLEALSLSFFPVFPEGNNGEGFLTDRNASSFIASVLERGHLSPVESSDCWKKLGGLKFCFSATSIRGVVG